MWPSRSATRCAGTPLAAADCSEGMTLRRDEKSRLPSPRKAGGLIHGSGLLVTDASIRNMSERCGACRADHSDRSSPLLAQRSTTCKRERARHSRKPQVPGHNNSPPVPGRSRKRLVREHSKTPPARERNSSLPEQPRPEQADNRPLELERRLHSPSEKPAPRA